MARQDDRRLRERMRVAVAALPPEPRAVYRLSAVEGLGLGAVAGRLAMTLDEVEAHLAEAIVRLGRMLEEKEP